MESRPTDPLVRYIRRLAEAQENNLLSDRELLHRFAVHRDQAAFTALVRRHGPMVLRVCRGVLRHGHDAEDVFQATFMILSRKAGLGRWQDSISKWLYKVAYRLALEAKAADLRRRARERPADTHQVVDPQSASSLQDAEIALDEELMRLPESLQLPLILCCLEGQSRNEAAQQLGCSETTIGRRLSEGRNLLRLRLASRGVALSTALLATELSNGALASGIPALLVAPTVRAAMAFAAGQTGPKTGISTPATRLAEGVLQAMVLTKVKLGAVLLTATLMVGTVSALVCQRLVSNMPEKAGRAEQPAQAKAITAPGKRKIASVDAFGDPLPKQSVFRLGTVQYRHPQLTHLTFTKDSHFLVSTGSDQVVRVWPIKNGQIRPALRYFADVDACALDGQDHLVVARHDEQAQPTITVYDMATGERIKAVQAEMPFVEALCGSPDGKTVYVVTNHKHQWTETQVLDLETGRVLRSCRVDDKFGSSWLGDTLKSRRGGQAELRLYIQRLSHVALDPGCQLTATTRGTQTILLWDTVGGVKKDIKVGDLVAVTNGLGFSPAGARLAISHCSQMRVNQADASYILEIWDTKTKKCCFKIKNKKSGSFAFSPDGKELATAASGKANDTNKPDLIPMIQFWDAATGKKTQTLQGSGDDAIRALAYSSNGKWLASGGTDGVIRMWDRQTGLEVSPPTPLAEPIASLNFTANGNQLLTAGLPGHLHWWDMAAGKITRTLRHAPLKYASLDISPDGGRIAAAGLKPGIAPTRSALLHLLGPNRYEAVVLEANGREVRRLRDVDSPCVKLYQGGRELLYIKKKAICCLDLDTGKEVFKLTGKDVNMKWFALSPDESLVAAEDEENFLCIWDVKTRRLLHSEGLVDWEDSGPPNPKIANQGNLACLYIDTDLRCVRYLGWLGSIAKENTCNEWNHSLAFSPDGRTLAFRLAIYKRALDFSDGDKGSMEQRKTKLLSKVCIIDLRSFKSLELMDDFHFYTSLAFAPDGRTLAGTGADGSSIHLYDVATHKKLTSFHGHKGSIWDLQFAPDGRQLYSVSEDATALVWDLTGRIGVSSQVSSDAPAVLPAEAVSARWADLMGEDAVKAYRALYDLATVPNKVLPLLRKTLAPVADVDPKRVKQLVADLDSDDFKKRSYAFAELKKLGAVSEPALQEAYKAKPALDVKRRIKSLLDYAQGRSLYPLTGEELRSVREVELLERIGNQEARDLLKKLAGGAPWARLTREAKASLRRLEGRTKP